MSVAKIVLFYVFTPLSDPEAVRLWQHALAERHGLTGRVIVSSQGINATLGGDVADLKQHMKVTKSYAPFRGADVKWSTGTGNDFPRLSVKVRDELVTFNAPDDIVVTQEGVQGGGEHLKPGALHKLVDSRGDDVVFFDGRNAMEAEIGRFRDAVVPQTDTTRDFLDELDSGKYDHLKDKAVVTYCTGGHPLRGAERAHEEPRVPRGLPARRRDRPLRRDVRLRGTVGRVAVRLRQPDAHGVRGRCEEIARHVCGVR